MEADLAIEVIDLSKQFGAFKAVNDVSLSIKKGEIFGLLGPNGAGKSTTIKMLCGILLPSGGSGTVNGYDVFQDAEKIKKNLGYMSQRFSLYDDLTVEENIDFYSGIYSVPKDKSIERKNYILETMKLKGETRRLTASLPQGLKQRLALGCAILHEPSLLFLDEPTSGVDPINRRLFWDLIYQMAGEGVTIIATTHYMEEAEYFDRMAFIYAGKKIAEGSPQSLKREMNAVSLEEVFIQLIEKR